MTTETNSLENILEGTDVTDTSLQDDVADTDTTKVDDKKADDKPKEEESWTKAAVLSERKKRQALEEEVATLKGGKEPPKPVARPSVTEDEEGAFNHVKSEVSQALLNERISLSREFMMDKHEDYELMESEFADMCKENPALATQMVKSPNPAKFAYQTAKNTLEAKKFSDPKSLEEIKARMKQEILDELKAQDEEEPDPKEVRKAAALKTPKLHNATSAQSGMAVPKAKSLEELFSR